MSSKCEGVLDGHYTDSSIQYLGQYIADGTKSLNTAPENPDCTVA